MSEVSAMVMNWILNIVETDDLCSAFGLLLFLAFVGAKVVQSQPELAHWGGRIGLSVLVLYVVFRGITFRATSPDDLLKIVLRGLLMAGFATTLTWILLPTCVGIWSITGQRILTLLRSHAARVKQRRRERRVVWQQQQSQKHAAKDYAAQLHDPARERQRVEAEARARVEREAMEVANRRRDEARLRSELLYERHARQLGQSFPRERFGQFMEKYMSDAVAPELVEQRELLLKEMITDSLGTAAAPKFVSMTELAAFFEARRQEIGKLPHDEQVRDTYLTQLNKQEDEALRKFLRP